MASRELVYRISLDTATAKRGAANIRAMFEKELRQIQLGKLDTSGLTAAQKQAHLLRLEFEEMAEAARHAAQSANAIKAPTVSSGGMAGPALPSNLTAGVLGAAGLWGAGQIAGTLADMTALGTESRRTGLAFDFLSGNATVAAGNIDAIKQASGGAVDKLTAMQIGNQALALHLADSAEGFDRLVRAARGVAAVSPVISDVQSAISELALAAANTSYRRLDQLGLSVQEVRTKMSELRRENDAMSESQAFLEAAISTLLTKYSGIIDAEENRATGLERIQVAISDLRTQTAEPISVTINTILNPVAGFLEGQVKGMDDRQAFVDNWIRAIEIAKTGIKDADAYQQSYVDSIRQTLALSEDWQLSTDEFKTRLNGLVAGLDSYSAALKSAADKEAQVENDRLASIFEQQTAIQQALTGRAQKSAATAGIEQSIELYRQQRAQVEQLLQQLADTGTKDTGEIAIRVAAITQELIKPFDELEAKAQTVDIGQAFGNLYESALALQGFDQPFIDALPNMAAMRDELVNLSTEMGITGELTAAQADQLDYLGAVAGAVSGSAGGLTDIVSQLGIEFLLTNENAAATVDQMFLAEGAFASGQISAEVYAGIISVLSGRLLTLAGDAGVATSAILALNQAQAGKTNAAGLATGQAVAQRLDLQQGIRQREETRRAAERAAREQESAAKRAGRALEDGAKKAAKELQGSLRNVPGLFGRSQVTAEQMAGAKAGIPQNFADDWLRRLEDEVKNGKDWADVDIKDAARRAGLDPNLPAEIIFQQVAEQWSSGAFFADKANLELINKEAVQKSLDLQEKVKQGQNNIYEYFGAQVDNAVAAATGGAVGGASGAAAGVTIDPATGEPASTTGAIMLTPSIDQLALQAQLDTIVLPPLALPVSLTFGQGAATGEAVSPVDGLIAKLSTDIGANAATFAAQGATVAQIIIAGMIASMKAQQQGNEGGGETNPMATALAGKLNNELTTMQGIFYAAGFGPAQSVESGFAGYAFDNLGNGVLDAVTVAIRKDADNYKQRGGTIATYIQAGINEGFGSNLSFTYAMNAGAAWGEGFMSGALGAIGGSKLAQAISDKVIEDIATEMEK